MYHAIAILAQLEEQGISNAQVVGSIPIDGINSPEVNFKIMAFKGTAGKSASGASMSKYDVEVEARLTKLEAHTHEAPCDTNPNDIQELKKAIFENGISSDKVSDIDSKIAWILDVINREVHRDYHEESKE